MISFLVAALHCTFALLENAYAHQVPPAEYQFGGVL